MPACSRSTRVLVAAALAVLAIGCGADDEEPTAAPSTTTDPPASVTTAAPAETTSTTESTTDPPSEEAAILAAVDGFFQVLLTSSAPPDPQHPDLERYLTGEQLDRTRALVTDRDGLGQALRPANPSRYDSQVTVMSISGDTASAQSCTVDDLVLFDRASGITLNDAVLTHLWALELQEEAGAWKVADTQSLQQWDGAVECE